MKKLVLALAVLTSGFVATQQADANVTRTFQRYDTLSAVIVKYFHSNYSLFKHLNPSITHVTVGQHYIAP